MRAAKIFNWQAMFGLVLLILSASTYYIHFLIFRDPRHIFLYLIGDIAFVFIEVLLVTLILHQLLEQREKKAMLKKMNMVIGVFFSEAGKKLITMLSQSDANADSLTEKLLINKQWLKKDFSEARSAVRRHNPAINAQRVNLADVKAFLQDERQLFLALLENPNLLEHEAFTDMLWAVFHLGEELAYRKKLTALPEADYEHLSGDIHRVYAHILVQWLDYLEHLSLNYPFLFSLEIRTNMFDKNSSVEIS